MAGTPGKARNAKTDAARPAGASPRFGSVPFPLKRHASPHGQVTAVSMMKDEGPYVIEWIAHHLALGFTDIVVYTNDCSDGTDDMLIRLEDLGLAHHRRNVIPEGQRPQPSALNHAEAEPVVQGSDWVMVFDADEFLSIRHGDGSLDGLLDAAVERGGNGIVVTWRIFGSGGVVDWSRAPVTEQYLCAAPPMWNKGWGVKTLFRHDPDCWKLGIHRPKIRNRHIDTDFPDRIHWLNGSGRPMEEYFKFRGWRSIARTVGHDWVQLNHYAVKSVDAYALRKLRGNVNLKKDKYNADYWSLQDRNEVRDDTMLRYSARRGAIIAQLLEDPVLHRLHHAALEGAEARLAELKKTEAYRQLVAELAAASAVPITRITAKPPQPRDPAKIAALMSEVEKRRSAQAREERLARPQPAAPGPYVPGGIDASREVPLDWARNHAVELPMDPRVFTPPALEAVAAGKFARGLARRLPALPPKGAAVLDLGAGCGFLAAQLALARPDLGMTAWEDDPGLRLVLERVLARNGLAGRLAVAEGQAAGLLARHRPEVLLLGSPAAVAALAALAAPLPGQVILHGRLAEAGGEALAGAAAALAGLGYEPAFDLDAVGGRGFAPAGAGRAVL